MCFCAFDLYYIFISLILCPLNGHCSVPTWPGTMPWTCLSLVFVVLLSLPIIIPYFTLLFLIVKLLPDPTLFHYRSYCWYRGVPLYCLVYCLHLFSIISCFIRRCSWASKFSSSLPPESWRVTVRCAWKKVCKTCTFLFLACVFHSAEKDADPEKVSVSSVRFLLISTPVTWDMIPYLFAIHRLVEFVAFEHNSKHFLFYFGIVDLCLGQNIQLPCYSGSSTPNTDSDILMDSSTGHLTS